MKLTLAQIKKEFSEFERNAVLRIDKGNKSAGVRSRKISMSLARLFKEWREESVKE